MKIVPTHFNHQSDLGSPEAQYDVYLTHPQGQVKFLMSLSIYTYKY